MGRIAKRFYAINYFKIHVYLYCLLYTSYIISRFLNCDQQNRIRKVKNFFTII